MAVDAKTPTVGGAAFFVPRLVSALRDLGGKAKAKSVRDTIVNQLMDEQEVLDESEVANGEAKYQNDIRWARFHLVNAGKLEPTDVSGHGVWQLTPEGWQMPLDAATAAAICGKGSATEQTGSIPSPLQDELPGIDQGDLALKNLLVQMPDAAFERLCAAIMVANNADETVVTGKANDGGIDGTATYSVDELKLITFRVAWQCKRYGTDNKVQPAAIREFRGALDQGFQHGIFFTTSSFTVEAVNEARRSGKVQITLVDIAGLIALLKSKGLGVTQLANDVWKVDQAYFDKFKQASNVHSANKKLFKAKTPAQ